MPYAISDSMRLYGTNEPVEPPRILQAGPLTVEFEAGNLRYIRYRGHEMIRAVSFVVRDKNWGTYAPQMTNLDFHEEPDSFRISYDAGGAALLTASEFELATHDFSVMNSLEREFADKRLILAPYAVARLRSRRR